MVGGSPARLASCRSETDESDNSKMYFYDRTHAAETSPRVGLEKNRCTTFAKDMPRVLSMRLCGSTPVMCGKGPCYNVRLFGVPSFKIVK